MVNRKQLRQGRVNAFLRTYLAGHTANELSQGTGLDYFTCRRVLKGENLLGHPKTRSVIAGHLNLDEKVLAAYLNGLADDETLAAAKAEADTEELEASLAVSVQDDTPKLPTAHPLQLAWVTSEKLWALTFQRRVAAVASKFPEFEKVTHDQWRTIIDDAWKAHGDDAMRATFRKSLRPRR